MQTDHGKKLVFVKNQEQEREFYKNKTTIKLLYHCAS